MRGRLPVLRASRRTHNVLFTKVDIAAATTTGYSLLTTPANIDDDPDHTIVSNGTTIAECAEGSRITGVFLEMEIAASDPVNDTYPVSFTVWKDSTFGALAAPTTASDVFVPGTTLQLATLKKNTCQYERFLMSVQGDKRKFRLHIPRRLRYLRQGEKISITVTNGAAATDAISFTIWGKIITVGA